MKLFIQQYKTKLILLFLGLYVYCVFYPLWDMKDVVSFSLAIDLVRPVSALICVLFIVALLHMPDLDIPAEDDRTEFKTGSVKVCGLLMLFITILLSAKTLAADASLIEPNWMNYQYKKEISQASREILAGCSSLTKYKVKVDEESVGAGYWNTDAFRELWIQNTIVADVEGDADVKELKSAAADILNRCAEIEKISGYNRILIYKYSDTSPSIRSSTDLEIRVRSSGKIQIYQASGLGDDFSFHIEH